MNVRILRLILVCLVVACVVLDSAPVARADDGVRGQGTATASEGGDRSLKVADMRGLALARARRAALRAVIDTLEPSGGVLDPRATHKAFTEFEAWTDAYRVLREEATTTLVKITIEADIDVAALSKRLRSHASVPTSVFAPGYRLGRVEVPEAGGGGPCVGLASRVRDEAEALGLAQPGARGPTVTVALQCVDVGVVPHTFLHAARVVLLAHWGHVEVARVERYGFGVTPESAASAAIPDAMAALRSGLDERAPGRIYVRVEGPLPAMRVRALERALRQRVRGVDDVGVAGIEAGGVVRLWILGRVSADDLAAQLRILRFPDFAVTDIEIEAANAITCWLG